MSSPACSLVVEEEIVPQPFSWRKLMRYAGPGLLMAIAYVDPGNLESDLQTGATAGYSLLWVVLATTFMGYLVQMLSARLGVATGKHMAELCREHYPRPASMLLWLMAEVAIVGSDIQEVIGSAIAISILSRGHIPLWGAALLSAAASFLLLLIERLGIRHLEGLIGSLIGVMVASFGFMMFKADVPASAVLRGFTVPELPSTYIPTAVAMVGALLMPHNLYLHSALVQTRGLQEASFAVRHDALYYFGIESAASLGAALVINTCIVCVFAAGFFTAGAAQPPDIGLQNAGVFLGETFGPAITYVWAVGLLAAGQSSTMTGTYTGQFVMSGFLDLKVSPWMRIIITRSVALVPTMAVALAMDPKSTQLDKFNQGLNLLQSLQLPFALVPLLTFTSSTALMGSLTSSRTLAVTALGIAALVVVVNMSAVSEVAKGVLDNAYQVHGQLAGIAVTGALICAVIVYAAFLLWLLWVSPGGLWQTTKKKKATGVGTKPAASGGSAAAAPAGIMEVNGVKGEHLNPKQKGQLENGYHGSAHIKVLQNGGAGLDGDLTQPLLLGEEEQQINGHHHQLSGHSKQLPN